MAREPANNKPFLDDLANTSLLARCIIAYSGELEIPKSIRNKIGGDEERRKIRFPQHSSSESRHALVTPLSMIRIMALQNQWLADVEKYKSHNDPLTPTDTRPGWKDERALRLFLKSRNWTSCSAAYPTIPRCFKALNEENDAAAKEQDKRLSLSTLMNPLIPSRNEGRIHNLPDLEIKELEAKLAEYARTTKNVFSQKSRHISRQSVMIKQALANLPSQNESLKISIENESSVSQQVEENIEQNIDAVPSQQEISTSTPDKPEQEHHVEETGQPNELKVVATAPRLRLVTSPRDVKFRAATYEALLPLLAAKPVSRPKQQKRRSTNPTSERATAAEREAKSKKGIRQQRNAKHGRREISLSTTGFGGRALLALLRVVSTKDGFQ